MSNNSSTRYYQKKQRLQKKACESYQNLYEEEQVKYGCERYIKFPEHEKQRLIEYPLSKNIY